MSKINGGGGNSIPLMLRRSIDSLMPKAQEQQTQVDSVVQQRTAGGYEVKVDDKKSMFLGRETSISSTREEGNTQHQRDVRYVNGRKQSSVTQDSRTNGDMTSSTKTERAYTRDGSVSRERFSSEVVQRYGEHSSIGRTNVTDGSFSSEAIKYTNTTGGTTRTTTATNSSGPRVTRSDQEGQLQYHGGEYMNGKTFGNRRWVKGRYESTNGVTYDNYRRKDTQTSYTRDTKAGVRGTAGDDARIARYEGREASRKRMQGTLDIAGEMGLRTTIAGGGERQTNFVGADWEKSTSADGRTTTERLVGPRASTSSYGEVTMGADGIRARGDIEARAGLYAETKGTHQTEFGTFSGGAGTKAEVFAEANGIATLNMNGLSARGYAGAGVEVSTQVDGSFRAPSVTVGGQKIDAGVSAMGRLAAEAKAEARGSVQFTGDPPRAIVEGRAGASAVVKAEGQVKVDAGPFGITAEGYVSAGAEAQVNGGIGYDDGKLTLGFGAGAALGVGAGARVQFTVDVKEVGKIAGGLAQEAFEATGLDKQLDKLDVTGDNEFNMKDVEAIGGAAVEAVGDAAEAVGSAVSAGAEAVGEAASAVGGAISDGASAVGGAISDGAEAVGEFFSGW